MALVSPPSRGPAGAGGAPACAFSSAPDPDEVFGFFPGSDPCFDSPSVVDEELKRDPVPGGPSRRTLAARAESQIQSMPDTVRLEQAAAKGLPAPKSWFTELVYGDCLPLFVGLYRRFYRALSGSERPGAPEAAPNAIENGSRLHPEAHARRSETETHRKTTRRPHHSRTTDAKRERHIRGHSKPVRASKDRQWPRGL